MSRQHHNYHLSQRSSCAVSDDLLEKIVGSLGELFRERFLNEDAVELMQKVTSAGRMRNRRNLFLARFFGIPELALKEVA